MLTIPLKSKLITEKDNLLNVIAQSLKTAKIKLQEKDIIIITSKVVSVTHGFKIKIKNEKAIKLLIQKEADYLFDHEKYALTLKNNILIPNAGIDQSNAGKNKVILWPQNLPILAKNLLNSLKKQFGIKNLGLIISDSHCQPLRRGIVGIALSYAGFVGIKDYKGKKDLFGRKMQVSEQNLPDLLASAALIEMGESNERIPFVIIRDCKIKFTSNDKFQDLSIAPGKCLFKSLYRGKI